MVRLVGVMAAIAFGLGVLGAAACSKPKPEEMFLKAIEEDFSEGEPIQEIFLKLTTWKYPGQEDPSEKLMQRYSAPILDEMASDATKIEEETRRLVELIQAARCGEVFQKVERNNSQASGSRDELLGILWKEGICAEKYPLKAATYFKQALALGPFPVSAAHLGALYLAGEGVARDEVMANRLFRQAVIWWAYLFLDNPPAQTYGLEYLDRTDSLEFSLWSMTAREMDKNFARVETGPWPLPEGLRDQIRWMEEMRSGDGSALIPVARALADGRDGYVQDPEGALGLLDLAYRSFGNREAGYLSARLSLDEAFCAKRKTANLGVYLGCEESGKNAIWRLEELAFDGYPKAATFLVDYYSGLPDSRWNRWSLYQAVVLAGKNGSDVDSKRRIEASRRLDSFERELIEKWIDDKPRISICEYVPKPKA